MNARWIFWAGFVIIGACSISRQRHSETDHTAAAGAMQVHHESTLRRDTAVERSARQLSLGRELLVIKPTGVFSYHPDSGFSGRASRIAVYREHAHEADTLQRKLGSETLRKATQQTAVQYNERTRVRDDRTAHTASRFPWWVVVAGGIAAFLLLLRFLRIR